MGSGDGPCTERPKTLTNVLDESAAIKVRLTKIREQVHGIEKMFGVCCSASDLKVAAEAPPIENAFFPMIFDTLSDQSSIITDIERAMEGLLQTTAAK